MADVLTGWISHHRTGLIQTHWAQQWAENMGPGAQNALLEFVSCFTQIPSLKQRAGIINRNHSIQTIEKYFLGNKIKCKKRFPGKRDKPGKMIPSLREELEVHPVLFSCFLELSFEGKPKGKCQSQKKACTLTAVDEMEKLIVLVGLMVHIFFKADAMFL